LAPNGQQRQANGQHHRGRSTSNVELPPSTSAKEITRPKDVSPPVLKETYLVSERTKDVIALVKRIIDEGKELSASGLFPSTSESKAAPGARLLQAALVPLELFRALYPVTFQSEIASCPERAMRFSNDCIYLSNELEKIRKQNADLTGMGDKFLECQVALKVWGDSCSKECVVSVPTSLVMIPSLRVFRKNGSIPLMRFWTSQKASPAPQSRIGMMNVKRLSIKH
jgi:hypothetical protein